MTSSPLQWMSTSCITIWCFIQMFLFVASSFCTLRTRRSSKLHSYYRSWTEQTWISKTDLMFLFYNLCQISTVGKTQLILVATLSHWISILLSFECNFLENSCCILRRSQENGKIISEWYLKDIWQSLKIISFPQQFLIAMPNVNF